VAAELNLRQQSEIREWAERILAITPADDEDRIVYWLTCATYGYKQNDDHARVRAARPPLRPQSRPPSHPLHPRLPLRRRRSTARGCREAVAWLRSHGEDDAAVNVENGGGGFSADEHRDASRSSIASSRSW
jgi:hypothetical protein